jgi:putative SOS response-associated peptidase YedK
MCGRFTLTLPDYAALARALGVALEPTYAGLYRPRYNVAPTDTHWILRARDGGRELVAARWGLVNSWSRDMSSGPRQINARSESARTKPAFREAFQRRRCVVPADGFFEWSGTKGHRRPLWYHSEARELLHLAGLYESWRNPDTGEWQRTFTILTTPANDLVAPVHDRMPAVLLASDVDRWLASEEGEGVSAREAQGLLRPAPAGLLVSSAASSRVNSVKNDDEGCLAPDADGQIALPLGSS